MFILTRINYNIMCYFVSSFVGVIWCMVVYFNITFYRFAMCVCYMDLYEKTCNMGLYKGKTNTTFVYIHIVWQIWEKMSHLNMKRPHLGKYMYSNWVKISYSFMATCMEAYLKPKLIFTLQLHVSSTMKLNQILAYTLIS